EKDITTKDRKNQCNKNDKRPDTEWKSGKGRPKQAKIRSVKSKSTQQNQQSNIGAVIEGYYCCNLTQSVGPRKANSIVMKTVRPIGPQSMPTAHLCAIDRDFEDFEGPI
ncbi:hypothetical protein Tco_0257776, partial [Tanacetum coccineum]